MPYHPARITRSKYIGRDIPGYNTAGANDASVANVHTGANNCTAAYPYIFTNGDGFRKFQSRSSYLMIYRVRSCIYLHIGAKQRTTADGYLCNIEHHAVEVEEYFFAQFYIITIVAVKWRLQPQPFPGIGNKFPKDAGAFCGLIFAGVIQFFNKQPGFKSFCRKWKLRLLVI